MSFLLQRCFDSKCNFQTILQNLTEMKIYSLFWGFYLADALVCYPFAYATDSLAKCILTAILKISGKGIKKLNISGKTADLLEQNG